MTCSIRGMWRFKKGRKTINTDQERLYMVKALKTVKDAWINRGSGLMDFEQELRELRPDIFFVNEDGYTPDKQKICKELGIEPDIDFNDRSGMSSSTRARAIELWHTDIPEGDKEKLSRTLFCVDNPPGTKYVSGSQDSIGIVYPGVNRLDYQKENYWPSNIESITEDDTR